GLAVWSRAYPNLAFLDSTRFVVWARASDLAGNVSATPSNADLDNDVGGITFTYDNTPPTSGTNEPPLFVNSPAFVGGASSDDPYFGVRQPSGVDKVRYKISRSDGFFWQILGGWAGVDPGYDDALDGPGTNPWKKIFGAGTFDDGYRYTVQSEARDFAGNVEAAPLSYSFIVDRSTPVSGIDWPNTGAFVSSAAVTVRGTAEDRFFALQNPLYSAGVRDFEAGILASSVTVAIAEVVVSTTWWDGSAFTSPVPVWSTATFVGSSSGTWTFALPPGALTSTKVYKVVARAKDRAGNLDLVTSTNTFIYDAAAPVAYATAPVGFNSGISAIYGTARDDSPGLLSGVRLTIFAVSGPDQTKYCNGSA
ncbi:MAG: hypothetical protein NUW21_02555, partial [Elusimicrobia bacterium]|nr:hypothetical protein [Elusimicrobiota bacterium]